MTRLINRYDKLCIKIEAVENLKIINESSKNLRKTVLGRP